MAGSFGPPAGQSLTDYFNSVRASGGMKAWDASWAKSHGYTGVPQSAERKVTDTGWSDIQDRGGSASSSSSSVSSPKVSTPSTPPVGSTGVSSPGTSAAPPKTVDTSANVRQSTTASSGTSSSSTTSTGLLDFDKMFEYQKRINRELDMPTLRETNQEGYKYRKLEGDDQMGRDTSARRDAAALAMQRDVLSSNLERGTMRQQQALQTRTKDQDLARAMSVLMKRKR